VTEESQVNPAAVDGSPIKEEKQQGSFWRAQFEDTGLTVLRIVFLIITGGISVFVIYSVSSGENPPIPLDKFGWAPYAIFFGMLLLAAGVIAFDMIIREKRLETISAVYFGLLVGLFLAYITRLALTPIFPSSIAAGAAGEKILAAVQLVLTIMLCYLCISFLLQTRHDFRFIIPYVEFARELRGRRPYVVDTSVIIDGRIADILERTRLFDSTLVIPRFVIEELQMIADGVDRAKRSRGRRGLDILQRLRANPDVDIQIFDRELPEFRGRDVDGKLVALAKHLEGRLLTNDYNLSKVARFEGVPVINLNDLANALKPVYLPGEVLHVRIIRAGDEPGQGVGYLDDGTMVVVENGRPYVAYEVQIIVTSVLQTSAGRMIFGKFDRVVSPAPIRTS
jgi:uncharacterized protein YacL